MCGFFLTCEDFGRMFDHSFPTCALNFCFLLIEVEISLYTLIPLYMPGSVHSGSASWDDCGQMFSLRTIYINQKSEMMYVYHANHLAA